LTTVGSRRSVTKIKIRTHLSSSARQSSLKGTNRPWYRPAEFPPLNDILLGNEQDTLLNTCCYGSSSKDTSGRFRFRDIMAISAPSQS